MAASVHSRGAVLGALLAGAAACTTTGSSSGPSLPGGVILSWGGNSLGQLGDGTTNQRLKPVQVSSPQSVKAIAAGGNSSMALTTDGGVFVWGDGQPSPAEVTGARGAKAIAAGNRHHLALMPDGSVMAWGDNSLGQLGDTTVTARPSPVQVVGLSGVMAIAAAGDQSYAIGPNFSLWSWGDNSMGQLGDGTKAARSPLQPAQVGTVQVIDLAASSTHALALTTGSEVLGWGSNAECQLLQDAVSGGNVICNDHLSPKTLVTAATGVSTRGAALATIPKASLWVLSGGAVQGTGGGFGTTNSGLCSPDAALGNPAVIVGPGPTKASGIAAGAEHVLFHDGDGNVWALGSNTAGQLGLGTTTVVECATQVPPTSVSGAVALAAGAEHSLALVQGVLEASPATLDLGDSDVGKAAAPKALSIRNAGMAPVSIVQVQAIGDGFSATDSCPRLPSSLAPGASCAATIGFTPAALGIQSGALQVTSNAVTPTWQVPLAGKGMLTVVPFPK